jgi:hypothetical protein
MPNITGVLARVFVDDIDAALDLYQSLSGCQEPARFRFRDVDLARVGPFLRLSGNTAAYRNRVATVLVHDLEPVINDVERTGVAAGIKDKVKIGRLGHLWSDAYPVD